VIEDFEWAFRFWNLISEGSLRMELYQDNELFSAHVTKDTVIINFHSLEAMDFLEPFIQKNLVIPKDTGEPVPEKRRFLLGIVGSLVSKKNEISKYLAFGQEFATVFYKHKKCLILQEKGRQLAKIGYGADSLGMRLLNLEHIEINDLSALMRLLDRAKI
jgi:hypothetical protein